MLQGNRICPLARRLHLSLHAVQQRIPERIVEKAVKGMLPRGRLGNNLYRHLKVRRARCLLMPVLHILAT